MAFLYIEDAARALNELGLLPPKSFEFDKFHVVDAEDGRRGNGAGRLKIFADGKGGFAQNWRTGERRSFFLEGNGASKPKPLTLQADRKQSDEQPQTLNSAQWRRDMKTAEFLYQKYNGQKIVPLVQVAADFYGVTDPATVIQALANLMQGAAMKKADQETPTG